MRQRAREAPLELLLSAGRARTRAEAFFVIVNRSVAAAPYDRASVWTPGRRPGLLAVSGTDSPDPKSSYAGTWRSILRRLRQPHAAGLLSDDRFRDAAPFAAVAATTGGLSAVWCPLPAAGFGVLFERWGAAPFRDDDVSGLVRLVEGYGLVLGKHREGTGGKWFGRLLRLCLLLAAAAALVLVRVPLRVVAECEVVARNPRLVSAPMDGVVDEVLAAPGQTVRQGDPLAVYDVRLMEEERTITQRQVDVVRTELASARARGFEDARYRGEVALLEARLEQELARLEAQDVRYGRRVVTAPVDGTVQLDDARAWRGRPVATGQAILWLVNPRDSRVDIMLPQDDRIDFDPDRPVDIHIHALGDTGRTARLTYVSSFARAGGAGGAAFFPAEAEWEGAEASPPLGLRGTASLYGREVRLGFWLFRRPAATLRRWLGL